MILKISGGPIARLPVCPPGCGPTYHQQHCMLTAKAGSSAQVIPCLCQV